MNDELAGQLERLHSDAFGWALHCCAGDAPQAEDVLQIAYLKVAQGRAVPSGRSTFKTWWFGVIRFTAREESRRRRSQEALALRFWRGLPSAESALPTPPLQGELDQEAARLRNALRQLPTRQAEVLHLVFYQDLSLSEVASVLAISLGSVRQHYDRGKTRLRALLTASPESHEGS